MNEKHRPGAEVPEDGAGVILHLGEGGHAEDRQVVALPVAQRWGEAPERLAVSPSGSREAAARTGAIAAAARTTTAWKARIRALS